jgi:uncharacterized protein
LPGLTVPRKFFRKYLPEADTVLEYRWIAPFARWLRHPNLWCLNRRSVSGAVAIGLFCGLIPGPIQMIGALLLAVPLRKNIPVALVVTLYTNPFTIVPLYLLAYGYGRLLLGSRDPSAVVEPFQADWTDIFGTLHAMWLWTLSLGKPLAIGLVALALTLAALGYAVVELGWRAYVVAAWRARARRRGRRQATEARLREKR